MKARSGNASHSTTNGAPPGAPFVWRPLALKKRSGGRTESKGAGVTEPNGHDGRRTGDDTAGWAALATLYHNFFTGLILTIASRAGAETAGTWSFNLFRRQHLNKFLSSFEKLGVAGLPHAVAATRYHFLSNRIGGVEVEYMEESDTKAWIRFPHPRWIYEGPAICGVPLEVGHGYLRGWYAYNGVSLGNPRLGFVCTSQDVTAEYGFAGYFMEYDRDLAEDERLRFVSDETPPPFDPAAAPRLDPEVWTPERLAKAQRNYAMEYVKSGLWELDALVGHETALELSLITAKLIGRQYYHRLLDVLGRDRADTRPEAFAEFMTTIAAAHGDRAEWRAAADGVEISQSGWRLVRGLDAPPALMFEAWNGLWEGCLNVHDRRLFLETPDQPAGPDGAILWRVG